MVDVIILYPFLNLNYSELFSSTCEISNNKYNYIAVITTCAWNFYFFTDSCSLGVVIPCEGFFP